MKQLLHLILFSIVILFPELIISQNCLPDGITLTSQTEIDNFAADYPGCTEIEGSLVIDEFLPGSITNLHGLSVIEKINGTFRLYKLETLTNLQGMNNLEEVGDEIDFNYMDVLNDISALSSLTSLNYLRLRNNPSLKSLVGLEGLEYIPEYINIGECGIENLIGLDNLQAVGESVIINSCDELISVDGLQNFSSGGLSINFNDSFSNLDALESFTQAKVLNLTFLPELMNINGLSNLTTIHGDLSLGDNPMLSDLEGLNNLTYIGEDLVIWRSQALQNLNGLESLERVGGKLGIKWHENLNDLNALQNLSSIGGELNIIENDKLADLYGLENIDPASISILHLNDNPLLSWCSVQSICDYLDIPGVSYDIDQNAEGCGSRQEILDVCETPIECTILINPEDGSTQVDATEVLHWENVSYATGYYLSIGTNSGGSDLLDMLDLGDQLTYTPDFLPCNSEIFVRIRPYNVFYEATDCLEESFTTFRIENSDCAYAEIVDDYSYGSTKCASNDMVFCDLGENDHSVFFKYENLSESTVNLNISVYPDHNFVESGATNLNLGLFKDHCDGVLIHVDAEFCDVGSETIRVDCIDKGEIIIIGIGSVDGGEGNFIIEIEEEENVYNDLCDQLGTSFELQPINSENEGELLFSCMEGTILPSCPDFHLIDNGNNCEFHNYPTVWYKIKTEPEAEILYTEINTQGLWEPVWAVLYGEDCDDLKNTGFWNYPLCSEGNLINDYFISHLRPSVRNYYLAISYKPTTTLIDDPTFELCVATQSSNVPENDDPCPDSPNPPVNLTNENTHIGTTCNAIGYMDDPLADFPNMYCGSEDDENAVWYYFDILYASCDSVVIELKSLSIEELSIEVYEGSKMMGCEANMSGFRKANCNVTSSNLNIESLQQGMRLWIKVAAKQEECGSFSISCSPFYHVLNANTCEEISSELTLNPETSEYFTYLKYACLESSFLNASPVYEFPGTDPGCNFSKHPTVWFAIQVDELADQLFTTVTTSGSWKPIWAIFTGDTCEELSNASSNLAPLCSNQDGTPDLQQISIIAHHDYYYVAVSADPSGPPIDYPFFDICAATTIDFIVCLGDLDDNCEPDPHTKIKITSRENSFLEPDVDQEVGYMGPFNPGEEVTVNIDFFYDAVGNGVDWFMGIIPDFGVGWDISQFDFESNAPFAGGEGFWAEAGSECAPRVSEDLPHLCTYTDEYGTFRLVNSLCENSYYCEDFGMQAGDLLPSGYFWMTSGFSSDCVQGSCINADNYGIGSSIVNLSWEFTIKVKEVSSIEELMSYNDLQISFQSFSDGGAGCWDDAFAECLTDRKQMGPRWELACGGLPLIIAETNSKQIESGESVDISLNLEEEGDLEIIVIYEDNPNVLGETNTTLENGAGIISDILQLVEGIEMPEKVYYLAHSRSAEGVCQGKVDTIEVIVNPKECAPLTLVFSEEKPLCFEDCNGRIIINTIQNGEAPFTYNWNTGQNLSMLDDLCAGNYHLTVTDANDCIVEQSFELSDPAELIANATAIGESIRGKNDGSGQANPSGGEMPYNYLWSNGMQTSAISALTPGKYNLTLTDANQCMTIDSIIIEEGICPSMNINIQQKDESCFQFCDGMAEVISVINGNDPFIYTWDTGENGTSINNLCAGEYIVHIKDSLGCTVSDTVVITAANEIELTVDSITHIATGQLGAIIVSTNDQGFYTYSWSGPENFTSNQLLLFNINVPGCYNLIITDDESGCMVDSTICIDENTGHFKTLEEGIMIYPNPSSGDFFIDCTQLKITIDKITLLSLDGKIVDSFTNVKCNQLIKTKKMSSGVYIAKIESGKSYIYIKLLFNSF